MKIHTLLLSVANADVVKYSYRDFNRTFVPFT